MKNAILFLALSQLIGVSVLATGDETASGGTGQRAHNEIASEARECTLVQSVRQEREAAERRAAVANGATSAAGG